MSTNLRYPEINGKSTPEQLAQLKSYLYQLVGELNYALESVGTGGRGSYLVGKSGAPIISVPQSGSPSALETFNGIKALIIKSADIVNAYYDEINRRLEGIYVAESDFGTYAQETSQLITETATGIRQDFSNSQTIISNELGSLSVQVQDVQAYIKTGLIGEDDNGIPLYGVEIRQKTNFNGQEIYNKCARFTADRLSFYDQNGDEAAYISDKKLYITEVNVLGDFTHGGFIDEIQSDGSIVTRWAGGN